MVENNSRDKTCKECNQECCRSVIVEMDEPTTSGDWEDIKWQVAHKNVKVILDNEDAWCIEFLTDCNHLDENGACKIYDKRPAMCRGHSPETCVINGEGDYYEVILHSIEDVEKYLQEHPDAITEEDEDEPTTCPKCNYTWVEEEDE